MKKVIQLDVDGFFQGFTTADESPLEPGVFHLPAGSVDAGNPPELTGGERAKWSGTRWVIVQPEPEPEPEPELTAEEVLAQARAAASMPRLDFAKLALREGWITAAEAKAWVPGNALPKIVTDIIAQHIKGADKQDIAEINALGQLVVNRNDLLLRLLMMSKKVTPEQMDAHFIAAAQVEV